MEKHTDCIKNIKTVKNEQPNHDSDSDIDSEYTYTDCSESEDSSHDSGYSAGGRKDKIESKKQIPCKEDTEDDPYSCLPLAEFSDDEQKTAEYFADWKKAVLDPDRDIVKELQDKFGDEFPECQFEIKSERTIVKLIGEKDEDGNIHGEVEIDYDNGDYFWGDFNHGVKEGMASVVLKNGDNYVGSFINGYLEGFVTETIAFCDLENVQREVFYSKGVRHGFYREIGPTKQFWAVGRFVNGRKTGSHWCWTRGNSFLIGPVNEENKPHGENIFFVYPDLTTTLRGDFSNGKMSHGRIVRLAGTRLEFGIPVPVVVESEDQTTFRYEPSGSKCISRSPLVRDPYEKRYVYVAESGVPLAGEGLMAKTCIMAGQVCSLFNGVRQHHLWGSPAMADNLPWSDYRLGCEKDVDLDILPEHTATHSYRATLAHKTCTSFNPNTHFAQFWHPRFGLIMSIVADRDIKAGEEVFVCYNYVMVLAPVWYQEQWFTHLRDELQWTEQQIYSWAGRMNKLNGLTVVIPPPDRNTNRFQPCGICADHVGLGPSSLYCKDCMTWYHAACAGIGRNENTGSEVEWRHQGCSSK